jgi:hypothetical protein
MYLLQLLSKSLLIICLLLINLFAGNFLQAQCCSTGSPVGASTYAGVLNKNTFRFTAFFRQSFSDI